MNADRQGAGPSRCTSPLMLRFAFSDDRPASNRHQSHSNTLFLYEGKWNSWVFARHTASPTAMISKLAFNLPTQDFRYPDRRTNLAFACLAKSTGNKNWWSPLQLGRSLRSARNAGATSGGRGRGWRRTHRVVVVAVATTSGAKVWPWIAYVEQLDADHPSNNGWCIVSLGVSPHLSTIPYPLQEIAMM